jgi:hypothetical protein
MLGISLTGLSDGVKFITHGGSVANALLSLPFLATDFPVSKDGLFNNVL